MRELGLFSLQKRRPRQGSNCSLQYLKKGWREDRFFLLGHNKRQWTQVAATEIPVGQKKTLLPSKGGSTLAQVPREAGESASLGMVRNHLDKALSNLF